MVPKGYLRPRNVAPRRGLVSPKYAERYGALKRPAKMTTISNSGFVVTVRRVRNLCQLLRDRIATAAGRSLALVGLAFASAATLAGCITTADLPDPALDVPPIYKEGAPGELPPELDWWRGFRSIELAGLIEEAQRVNLDIAAAAARIVQADASARV